MRGFGRFEVWFIRGMLLVPFLLILAAIGMFVAGAFAEHGMAERWKEAGEIMLMGGIGLGVVWILAVIGIAGLNA